MSTSMIYFADIKCLRNDGRFHQVFPTRKGLAQARPNNNKNSTTTPTLRRSKHSCRLIDQFTPRLVIKLRKEECGRLLINND